MAATRTTSAPRPPGRGWTLRDPLAIGVLVSLLLHGLLFALRFSPPSAPKPAPTDSQLEVVLLNARTEARPSRPDALAQVDMSAAGDRDAGRATSPLRADLRSAEGADTVEQRRRARELLDQQRRLLTAARSRQPSVDPGAAQDPQRSPAQGVDAQDTERVIARMQAQIERQIAEGGKRPKRLTYGVNAIGVSHARYVADWAAKVERVGTEHYPPEARGRLYDALLITVEIDRDGNVVEVVINKPSRHEALNRAVRRIVLAGAPYARFTPEMAAQGDTLQIVRTWTFTNDALATRAAGERP